MKPLSTSVVKPRGFTVLEILIVIVIVGVLASMAFPRYFQVRDRSYVGAAQADLALMRQALAFYAAEHASYPETLASLDEMEATVVDPQGRPYLTLPSGRTFDWVSYEITEQGDYLLKIQALDNHRTVLCATGDHVTVES